MVCKRCDSDNQSTLNGEVAIHYPGLKGLDKPISWVFPKILVCLDCGFTEFTVPEKDLSVLVQADAAAAWVAPHKCLDDTILMPQEPRS
jgi:hypothetical protein